MSNSAKKIRGIYAITPDTTLNLKKIEKIIIEQKITILQYRRKTSNATLAFNEASKLRQLCLQYHTLFIINDDINLALKVAADGVHLGKNDASIDVARATLGTRAIIGVSCYNALNRGKIAERQGADYVAFGALFTSNSKPDAPRCTLDIIQQAKGVLSIPVVGIGGIDFHNQQLAFEAGCDCVAMIGALFE
jgi:thiamine-phosphate pyrophosphorylase